MTRVLFGQSYYLRFDTKLWRAMQPYPPLGTLYAASDLRQRGYDVALFDAMLEDSEERWGESIARTAPEFAVIFEDNFNYLSKMCLSRMRTAAFRMIELAKQHGCRTIVCGSDATDNAARYLERGADYVIVGEGEVTLAELLDRLTGRAEGDPAAVAGVATLASNGTVALHGRRENLRDLDALPFPAWDLVDVDRYRAAWADHGRFSMNMSTTRGCPFHCNWCAKPIWGQRYAVRSPENVSAELEMLRATYRPDHISFVDDIFGLKPGWTRSLADILQAHGTTIPFKCLSRADLLLRDGEVDALRDAGCETVWMGAESGSQQILDAMEKGTTVEQIIEASRRLRAAGVRFGLFLQFGYPGEGPADIEATRRLVRECQPDDIGISVSYPLPGTRFFERVKLDLGAKRNWIDSDDLAMLYHGPFSTRYYRHLHGVVHKEFRLRRAGGTVSPVAHLGRAVTAIPSRERLARAKDAVTLPIDQLVLAGMQRLERRHDAAG